MMDGFEAAALATASSSVCGERAIVVDGLCKRYKSHWAVDGVSFRVNRGGTVGILGGNGAGKTTTIAMIMGLVIPTAGSVRVLGHDMANVRFKVLHRMNFQSPYVAMPAKLTVRENLTIFGHLYRVPDLKARIEELVEEFDLGDVFHNATGKLSAGQKTRVSIAKALLNNPDVLLLDEPTASLDPDRAEWIRERLQAYQRRRDAAILLSSHNMGEVEAMCDYVVIMSRGQIVECGHPKDLMRLYECDTFADVFFIVSRRTQKECA